LRRLTDLLTDVEKLQALDRQEATDQVLLSKRRHYTTTRGLVWAGLTAVLGSDPLNNTEELTEQKIVKRIVPWLNSNLPHVQRILDRRDDLSTDPMFVFRRLLAYVGLKLARRQIMRDSERTLSSLLQTRKL
jgi:hypothetical protein